MSYLPRASPKASELANIPKEATLFLAPPVDSSSQKMNGISSSNIDPGLIPRLLILRNVVPLLCEKEHVNRLTLRGMGGLGKSTLAAMCVSLNDVRCKFDHILWLNLGNYFTERSSRNNLNYDTYLDCLRQLCRQLHVSADRFCCEVFIQPGDDKLLIASKTIRAMEESKLEMSQIIDGLNILIVLDDVWNHEDVEFFNFSTGTSFFRMLLTTRTLDQEPILGSELINVELLNRAEASCLFSIEAGLDSIDAQDVEPIDAIINKCGYLPLTLRMAGRLVKKSRTIQADMCLSKIAEIILKESDSPAGMVSVNEIIDRSFLFVTEEKAAFALRLFLCSFTVVFSRDDILRPWVPFESVELLWMGQLKSESMKVFRELGGKYELTNATQITDLMCIMGIFDEIYVDVPMQNRKKQRSFRIHHDLIWDYGKQICSHFNTVNGKMTHCRNQKVNCFEESAVHKKSVLQWNTVQLNKMLVKQFMLRSENSEERRRHWDPMLSPPNTRTLESMECITLPLLDWLPIHMIKAGLMHEAVDILRSDHFVTTQIKTFGIESTSRLVVSCIRSFEKKSYTEYLAKNDTSVYRSPMVSVIYFVQKYLQALNTLFKLDNKSRGEIGCAIILLGVELQKFSKWAESLDFFLTSLNIFHSISYSDDHPDTIRATKYIDSCAIQHVILVRRDSKNKLRLKNPTSLLKDGGGESGVSLELSSNPGYGIVRMSDSYTQVNINNNSWEYVTLGVGLKDSALVVNYDGHLIRNAFDGRMFYVGQGSFYEGMSVTLRSSFKKENDTTESKLTEKILQDANDGWAFTIDPEGIIYPTLAPHLCLGISPFPILYLVAHDSPSRAVFKHFIELSKTKKPQKITVEENRNIYQSSTQQTVDNGITLELESHPGMGIVSLCENIPMYPMVNSRTCTVGLGPVSNALTAKLNEDDHLLILGKYSGSILWPVTSSSLESGVVLVMTFFTEGDHIRFKVNDDGTISPIGAEHLVLGFQVPGSLHKRACQVLNR